MGALHYGKAEHIKTVMESYSNDTYEKVPFTLDAKEAKLTDKEVESRIGLAVYKRFKPSHFGGCGYSCTMTEFHRETPTTGYIVLMHYHGIGD